MSRSDDELDALLGALGPPAGSAPRTPPAQILARLAPPPAAPPPARALSGKLIGAAIGAALMTGFVAGVATTLVTQRAPRGEPAPLDQVSGAAEQPARVAAKELPNSEAAPSVPARAPSVAAAATPRLSTERLHTTRRTVADRAPLFGGARPARPGAASAADARFGTPTAPSTEAALAPDDAPSEDVRDPESATVPVSPFDPEEGPKSPTIAADLDDLDAPASPGPRPAATRVAGVTPPKRPNNSRTRPDVEEMPRGAGLPGRWSIGVHAGPRAYGPTEWGASPSATGARTGASAFLDLAERGILRPRLGLSLDVGAALAPTVLPPDGSAAASAELRFALGRVHPVVGWTIGGELHASPRPAETPRGEVESGEMASVSRDAPASPAALRAALVSGVRLGLDVGRLDRPHLQLRVDATTRVSAAAPLPPPSVGLLVGVAFPLHGGEG